MLEAKNRRQLKKLLEDKTLRVLERNISDNGTYFKVETTMPQNITWN